MSIHEKRFTELFKELSQEHSKEMVWNDFISMCACAFSNAVDKTHFAEREELYLQTIKKYGKQEQQVFPELLAKMTMALEENRKQDFLGSMFIKLGLNNHANGQFFTPYHICDCMAKLTMADVSQWIEQQGYITLSDPTCGAGATLIAGVNAVEEQLKGKLNWQNHVLIEAQDIDQTVGLMCYIQLSLLGAAGYVKIGNSLTEPICEKDSTENYWFTPMYFSSVWQMRRALKGLDLL